MKKTLLFIFLSSIGYADTNSTTKQNKPQKPTLVIQCSGTNEWDEEAKITVKSFKDKTELTVKGAGIDKQVSVAKQFRMQADENHCLFHQESKEFGYDLTINVPCKRGKDRVSFSGLHLKKPFVVRSDFMWLTCDI